MISIILTTYKRPVFLVRAIQSVLNQNYKNIELIVVDDNDSDSVYRKDTSALIASYAKTIKYIPLEKNSGACNARNIGIDNANGDYILFLDDDDELLPNHLELLLQQYSINENVGVVFSQAKLIDVKNNSMQLTNKVLRVNDDPLLWQLLVGANSTSCILFRKKAILEVGKWVQLPFGHENYLMVRIFANAYKGVSVNEITVNVYYEDTERISNNSNRLKGIDILYEKIVPYTLKYSNKVQRQFKYNFIKTKVLLNIDLNYWNAWRNYKKMLQVDFFNANNLKFLILLFFPFPNFLGLLNNFYRTIIPKTLF